MADPVVASRLIVPDSVISGAAAGLAVTIVVGFFGWMRHRFRRLRQWSALREVINQSYADYTKPAKVDRHRKAFREGAYRTLESAISAYLESGVPDLRFKERYQIEKAFEIPRRLVSHHKATVGTGAHKTFNALLEIKALGLTYDVLEPDDEFKSYVIEEIPNNGVELHEQT